MRPATVFLDAGSSPVRPTTTGLAKPYCKRESELPAKASAVCGRWKVQRANFFWNMFYDFTKEELDELQEVLFRTAMQSGAMMPPAPCLIKAHQRYRATNHEGYEETME